MPTPVSTVLAAEFNRRLGDLTGAPVLPTPRSLIEGTEWARSVNEARRGVMLQSIIDETRRTKAYKDKMQELQGGGSGGGSGTGLSDETKTLIREAKESGFTDESKPNTMTAIPGVASAPPGVTEALRSPIMWGLDKFARPFWAGTGALKERAVGLGEGQNQFEVIPEMLQGAWGGIKGKPTGFGEIVEANASREDATPDKWNIGTYLNYLNPSTSPVSPANVGVGWNEVAREHPKLAPYIHAAKIVAGFSGDLIVDPLNVAGGKVVGRLRVPSEAATDASKTNRALHALGQTGDAGVDFEPQLLHDQVLRSAEKTIDKRGWGPSFRRNRWMNTGPSPYGGATTGWRQAGIKGISDVIRDTIDDVLLQVKGGAMKGRIKGVEQIYTTIAARVSENMRKFHFAEFDRNLAQYEAHLFGPNRLTPAQIAAARASDPIFNSYMDEILAQMNRNRPRNPFATIDDALAHFAQRPTNKWKQWSDGAVRVAKKSFDDEFEGVSKEILDDISGSIYNAPGIRIGSKVIPFDRIGRAYAGAMGGLKDSGSLKMFSHGRQFPGRTNQMTTALAATGLHSFENFQKEVQLASEGFTDAEREILTDAIVKERDFPHDPRMQQAKDFIQEKYEEMRLAEEAGGVRTGKKVRNYVYNYYRGSVKTTGRPRHIRAYKKDVQELLAPQRRRSGDMLFAADHVEKAVAKGLKPEIDPFRALLYRKLKSNRLLTKSWFTEDLLDHYGVLADNLSGTAARARGLEPVITNIPQHIKQTMARRQRWYLPSDVKQVYDNFTQLASGTHNEGMSTLLKTYDRLLRLFKFSTTIPYPGFHIRNAIGDIFMSHFDGVKFADYKRTFDLWRRRNLQGPATAGQIFIGDRHFNFDELWHMFKGDASASGFFNTDISKASETIAQKVNPNRAMAGLRSGSAFREDFFRFSHWLHALREEYPAALRTSVGREAAMTTARHGAIYRVNKYLYDYNALTRVEKEGLRRVLPFYTYTRKTIPALMEGAFLRPDILSKTNRMFIQPGQDKLQDMMPPDYLREIGFSVLPGGSKEEPNILSAGLLPTDILNKNFNFRSNEGFFGNIFSQLAPLPKAAYELQRGKLAFNEQEIKSQRGYWVNSLFPLAGNVGETLDSALPGRPANAVYEALGLGSLPRGKGKEDLIANRIGLGIPVSKLRESQQNAAYYDARQEIYDAFKPINDELEPKGIRIILSERKEGTSYRVRLLDSGKVLFETKDPREAIRYAQQVASER